AGAIQAQESVIDWKHEAGRRIETTADRTPDLARTVGRAGQANPSPARAIARDARAGQANPRLARAVGRGPGADRGAGKEKERASRLRESQCGQVEGKEAPQEAGCREKWSPQA